MPESAARKNSTAEVWARLICESVDNTRGVTCGSSALSLLSALSAGRAKNVGV